MIHGDNLAQTIAIHGGSRDGWIDLSTGINPHPYPAPALADAAWHRLPEPSQALLAAARACYCEPHLLPVAGTQADIQALPRLREPARVAIAAPTYGEYAHWWKQAGHAVQEIVLGSLSAPSAAGISLDAENATNAAATHGLDLRGFDVLVVCNPNNPSGTRIAPERLLQWADTDPAASIAPRAGPPGLIVLRSVRKFFGLAGLRLSFVCAQTELLGALAEALGPWQISGPAQDICAAALADAAWQTATRHRLQALLAGHGLRSACTPLFQWWPARTMALAPEDFQARMAERHIWPRLFPAGSAAHSIRLAQALEAVLGGADVTAPHAPSALGQAAS
ncbi:MAG: aminotransferase class I/II-fold pyridoxal phosphate-dependent enzyme [Candidatus Protistobacter heckmanni]|nr:aminotransferase class I/II-fold pyridoxal phosphate-dependent enzyme [Candidatus Protistobacter heckmanni]